MTDKILPLILAGLMAIAAIPYFAEGDWRHGTYWVAAAVINVMVTI